MVQVPAVLHLTSSTLLPLFLHRAPFPACSVFQFGHAPFNATASYLFLTTKVGTTITPYVSSLVGPYTDLSAITWKNAYGNAASTIAPASDLPK